MSEKKAKRKTVQSVEWATDRIFVHLPKSLDPVEWCNLADYIQIFKPSNVITTADKLRQEIKKLNDTIGYLPDGVHAGFEVLTEGKV